MARGDASVAVSGPDLPALMRDVFGEIAEHAERAGTVVMLEPADPGYVAVVLRVHEAAEQARLVGSPGFSIMLDTHQLEVVEPSFEEGFAAAEGRASHIHLYDPGHWPPGVAEKRLDWDRHPGRDAALPASVAPDRWCWRPRATATPRRGRRSPSCGRR